MQCGKTIYSGPITKSNIKDHYGDVVITHMGKIAEKNDFSASDEMLWVRRQNGRQQVDCVTVCNISTSRLLNTKNNDRRDDKEYVLMMHT